MIVEITAPLRFDGLALKLWIRVVTDAAVEVLASAAPEGDALGILRQADLAACLSANNHTGIHRVMWRGWLRPDLDRPHRRASTVLAAGGLGRPGQTDVASPCGAVISLTAKRIIDSSKSRTNAGGFASHQFDAALRIIRPVLCILRFVCGFGVERLPSVRLVLLRLPAIGHFVKQIGPPGPTHRQCRHACRPENEAVRSGNPHTTTQQTAP